MFKVKNALSIPLAIVLLLISVSSVASKDLASKNYYLPYLQVGGTRFFNVKSSDTAASIDLFVPLWQESTKLLFNDIRIYDRSSKPFEGNIHLGYRYLVPEKKQLYGIYGAFDRKCSGLGNYFSQLTLGAECWWSNFFLGGNYYQPVGDTAKFIGLTESAQLKPISSNIYNIWISSDEKYEKAMGGADAEAGYEFIKGLTGYVGGYYFKAKATDTVYGPKAKLAYDWFLDKGQRAWGLFDKFGIEAGVQMDKPRGTIWYLGANFRIGLLPKKNYNLEGVARHMIDLVRRDVDIVSGESRSIKQDTYKENGRPVTVGIFSDNAPQILATLEQPDSPDIIFTRSSQHSHYTLNLGSHPKRIIFGDHLLVPSSSGLIHKISVLPNAEPTPAPQQASFLNLMQAITPQGSQNIKVVVNIKIKAIKTLQEQLFKLHTNAQPTMAPAVASKPPTLGLPKQVPPELAPSVSAADPTTVAPKQILTPLPPTNTTLVQADTSSAKNDKQLVLYQPLRLPLSQDTNTTTASLQPDTNDQNNKSVQNIQPEQPQNTCEQYPTETSTHNNTLDQVTPKPFTSLVELPQNTQTVPNSTFPIISVIKPDPDLDKPALDNTKTSSDQDLKADDTSSIFNSARQILAEAWQDTHPVLGFSSKEASEIFAASLANTKPLLTLSANDVNNIAIESLGNTQLVGFSGFSGMNDFIYKIPVLTYLVGSTAVILTCSSTISWTGQLGRFLLHKVI